MTPRGGPRRLGPGVPKNRVAELAAVCTSDGIDVDRRTNILPLVDVCRPPTGCDGQVGDATRRLARLGLLSLPEHRGRSPEPTVSGIAARFRPLSESVAFRALGRFEGRVGGAH